MTKKTFLDKQKQFISSHYSLHDLLKGVSQELGKKMPD
jgi:hypothetical protein